MKRNPDHAGKVYTFPAAKRGTLPSADLGRLSQGDAAPAGADAPDVMVLAGFGSAMTDALRQTMPDRTFALVSAADAEQTTLLQRVYQERMRYLIVLDDGEVPRATARRRATTWGKVIPELLTKAPRTVLVRLATRREERPKVQRTDLSFRTVTVGEMADEVVQRVTSMNALVALNEAERAVDHLRPGRAFASCEEAQIVLCSPEERSPDLLLLVNQGHQGAALTDSVLRVHPSALVLALDHLSREDLGAELSLFVQIANGAIRGRKVA